MHPIRGIDFIFNKIAGRYASNKGDWLLFLSYRGAICIQYGALASSSIISQGVMHPIRGIGFIFKG
ncbi:hypothetical protein, partial [Neobacillus sp. 19]|uniref:hypothetical protein n=1 Tax=Neobacillus sp. 19 TaxID=3394458 RepID=UPI003C2C613D